MPCSPETLKHVPLFALLDDEETAVLAGQVEVKKFAPRQRIYKIGDPGGRTSERQLLTPETLRHNVTAIKKQLGKFLDFDTAANPARALCHFEDADLHHHRQSLHHKHAADHYQHHFVLGQHGDRSNRAANGQAPLRDAYSGIGRNQRSPCPCAQA